MLRPSFPIRPLALLTFLSGLSLLPVQTEAAELMQSNLGTPPAWKSWDRMTVTAPGFMSKSKTIQLPDFLLKIWAKEIAENDQKFRDEGNVDLLYKDGHAHAKALYSVYQDSGRTVVVSILDAAKFCQEGPNDPGSTQIHSTCPVRVTVMRGGEVTSADYPGACFLDISYGNPPGGPGPLTNASLTRYDQQTGVVELVAIRDNRSLPECAKQLKVPPL